MVDVFFGGGLNEQDEFNVSIEECTAGQNFKLDAVSRQFRPREPLDAVGTLVPGGVTISGIMQLIKRDDSQTQLVAAGTNVFTWDFATLTTANGLNSSTITTDSRLRGTRWMLDEILVVTDIDLNTPLHQWNGTTWQRLAHGVDGTTVRTLATGALTRTGSTATVVDTSHGRASGELVRIAGADQTAYNGQHEVTVSDANTYTFAVSGSPTTPATGTIVSTLGVDLRAKFAIEHDGRVWLFNVQADGAHTPHMLLASAFEDVNDFDTAAAFRVRDGGSITASSAFFDLTPDLKPITAVAKFYDTLVVSTEQGRLFKLTGNDATNYRWVDLYPGSAAVGPESMVNTGNDVHFMRTGGHIEALSSTDRFGDVSADDLSRFIPTQINGLSSAIAVYDQSAQYVWWFVSGKALVWDKEHASQRPELSPWSVYKTTMAHNFNTLAAAYLRRSDGTFSVYFGDDTGQIYDCRGSSAGDGNDGVNIVTNRTLPRVPMPPGGISGRIEYKRRGETAANMTFDWAEEYNSSSCQVPLKGPLVGDTPPVFGGAVYFGGSFYFNAGVIAAERISTTGFTPVGRAPAVTVTIEVNTTVNFQINRIIA